MFVLQNATNKGRKVTVLSIYDKVPTHIRALESLGVTTDMLNPLVESSLPEETLRAWQRSNNAREAANTANAANEAGIEKVFPSLNACLEKGPNLIELIPDTLLRLREHEIVVVADVRKAFLQIEVSSKDRDFLRFL